MHGISEQCTNPGDGLPTASDLDAQSADPELPAFIARPLGSQVYDGFRVLPDVVVDGFTFGTITEFGPDADDAGDAFVIAPDGSRCGLVWEHADEPHVNPAGGISPDRWGVWDVGFPHRMREPDDARRNLEAILPLLRPHWEQWRADGFGPPD